MDYTRSLVPAAASVWPVAVVIGMISFVIAAYLYTDYTAFIDLGEGGTPQTFMGYLRVKSLTVVAIHPFDTSLLQCTIKPGHLESLPDRGPRPVIRGIAPHRQIDQRASKEQYEKLHDELLKMCSTNSSLKLDVSWFEKHNPALFTTQHTRISGHGEICHAHPLDGSMHMTLHPADIKTVIDARWGERHPLARGGQFEMFVPENFVMVYAPRNDQDIDVLMQIVQAGVLFASGIEASSAADALEQLT